MCNFNTIVKKNKQSFLNIFIEKLRGIKYEIGL